MLPAAIGPCVTRFPSRFRSLKILSFRNIWLIYYLQTAHMPLGLGAVQIIPECDPLDSFLDRSWTCVPTRHEITSRSPSATAWLRAKGYLPCLFISPKAASPVGWPLKPEALVLSRVRPYVQPGTSLPPCLPVSLPPRSPPGLCKPCGFAFVHHVMLEVSVSGIARVPRVVLGKPYLGVSRSRGDQLTRTNAKSQE